jgi:hypothetical protein
VALLAAYRIGAWTTVGARRRAGMLVTCDSVASGVSGQPELRRSGWLRQGRLADARSTLVGCPPRPAGWWPLAGHLAAGDEVVAAYRAVGDGELGQA